MPRVEYTYEMISPLLVQSEVQGNQIYCQFALPGSDEVHEATAPIRRTRSVQGQVQRQVSRTMMNEVRRGLFGMLRSILGGGIVGRTARTAARTASSEAQRNIMNAPSGEDKRNAVLSAFQGVAQNFHYDHGSGIWTGSAAAVTTNTSASPSPFEAQLQAHAVSGKFEKDVLARLLAQAAFADGELSDEEAQFFEDVIPPSMGSVTELASSDRISAVEAEEINAGVRESIYMLAWAISAIDMEVSGSEAAVLQQYAETFQLNADRAEELAKLAKFHVLEGHLTTDISRDELFDMGRKLGLSDDDAERCKVRWMKRQ